MTPWEIHPSLVHFPIAFLLGGVILDLWAAWRVSGGASRVAYGLLVAGVATGLIAAAAGLVAFYTVPAHTEEAHTIMWWHLGINAASLLVFTGIILARRRRRGAGVEPSILDPGIRHGHVPGETNGHEEEPGAHHGEHPH